ncbi:MAG: proteasome accessory factor PafA2 family protein, partial [Arcanobacterium sp.]|nr:proteasome accessory factor PafA2 family protein [Arcanobacterium sp.]
MTRRILGIETEYGIMCSARDGGGPPISAEDAAQRLFAPVLQAQRTTNAYLANGARLYLDVGAHPEYATAECDGVRDLIINDRAGDAILARMADEANDALRKEGIDGTIRLFKNNLDSEGNSFGCHENYLVRRRRDFRARIDSLIPFFVSRQIIVGSGYINTHGGHARYNLSQRSYQMVDAVSAASTRSRPMINTRDEPHGNPELYRRMHVIVGDSNIIDATCALKTGATAAVLDAMEAGVRFTDVELADPIAAIRTICEDPT